MSLGCGACNAPGGCCTPGGRCPYEPLDAATRSARTKSTGSVRDEAMASIQAHARELAKAAAPLAWAEATGLVAGAVQIDAVAPHVGLGKAWVGVTQPDLGVLAEAMRPSPPSEAAQEARMAGRGGAPRPPRRCRREAQVTRREREERFRELTSAHSARSLAFLVIQLEEHCERSDRKAATLRREQRIMIERLVDAIGAARALLARRR